MICPACKIKLKTVDVSHNNEENEDYRRLVCPKCGKRFGSIEMLAEDDYNFFTVFRHYYRKRKEVNTMGCKKNKPVKKGK